MSDSIIAEYFEALERIKKGMPVRTKKGRRISNDLVALEAGRGKGSIKKSREIFENLISAIKEAAKAYNIAGKDLEGKLLEAKDKTKNIRNELDAALARELSLLYELYEAKKTISRLTGEKVIPIRSAQKSFLPEQSDNR